MSGGELTAGMLLDEKWRIEGLLGAGGMGAVYAARHVRNGREVALKLLHPAVAADRAARDRFLQEGYAANQVDHPGAVQVLDDGVCSEGVFLVMERLRGASIESIAEARGDRLELVPTLALLDAALEVVAAAHRRGMVHRDLKPENLFLTEQGVLKVLDFGLARVRQSESGVKLTATGVPMGTPAFMPPEQALAHWDQVDASSDVFALGASAYTLLSGQLVHPARTPPEMLVMASTRRASPIRATVPGVPPTVAQVIDRALAFEPATRFRDAAEMRAALRAALAADRISLPPLADLELLANGVGVGGVDAPAHPSGGSNEAVRTVPAITPSVQAGASASPVASVVAARHAASLPHVVVRGRAAGDRAVHISELGPTETVAPITSDRGRTRAGSVALVVGAAAVVGVVGAAAAFVWLSKPGATTSELPSAGIDAAGSPSSNLVPASPEVEPGGTALPDPAPSASAAPRATAAPSATSTPSGSPATPVLASAPKPAPPVGAGPRASSKPASPAASATQASSPPSDPHDPLKSYDPRKP